MMAPGILSVTQVSFDAVNAFTASFNLPTIALIVVGGAFCGWAIMRVAGRFPLHADPFTVGLITVNVGVVYEVLTAAGAAIVEPNQTVRYLVVHLAYILIDILFGVALGGGMKLGQRRVSREEGRDGSCI